MALFRSLQSNRAAIAAVQPLGQTVPVVTGGWSSKIGHLPVWQAVQNYAQNQDLIQGTTLSLARQHLIDAAASGVAEDVCFLLDMLWGYGSGRGRGRAAVLKMLQDPGLSQHLVNGRSHVAAGRFQDAFDDYQAIDGLGMSFVSKVLYFESRAADPTSYLPIFDNRVAQKLLRLSLAPSDRWLCSAITCGRGQKWSEYDSYTRKLRQLSRSLRPSVDLEQLEYWLFL